MHTHLRKNAIVLAFSFAFLAFLRCFFPFSLPAACVCAGVWQSAITLFSWPRQH